ncbi:MAG: hypothetical protein ABSF21_00965 [Dehalococcoidia bacterium]
MEKPKILTADEVGEWMELNHKDLEAYTYLHSREAQLDADVAYYQERIHKQDLIWQQQIEQAKTEVAREMIEAIENSEATPSCPCGCWERFESKYTGGRK